MKAKTYKTRQRQVLMSNVKPEILLLNMRQFKECVRRNRGPNCWRLPKASKQGDLYEYDLTEEYDYNTYEYNLVPDFEDDKWFFIEEAKNFVEIMKKARRTRMEPPAVVLKDQLDSNKGEILLLDVNFLDKLSL